MLKSVLALALAASIAPAFAQEPATAPRCLPVNDLIAAAKSNYQEVPFLIGKLSKDGYFILVLMSPDGASWTMVSVGPNEIACLVATGSGMRPIPRTAPAPDKPKTPDRDA